MCHELCTVKTLATRFPRHGREVANNPPKTLTGSGLALFDSDKTTELYPRSSCPSPPRSPCSLLVITCTRRVLHFIRSKQVSFWTASRVVEPKYVCYTLPSLTIHCEHQVKHGRLPTKLLQGVVFLPTTPHALPPSPSSPPPTSGTVFSESNKPDIILRYRSRLSTVWC